MKLYYTLIWSEGFVVTGTSATAQLLGKYSTESFDDAVEMYLQEHPASRAYHTKNNKGDHFIWGCQLFDNETDARKSFG